jgi:hypothetical protein
MTNFGERACRPIKKFLLSTALAGGVVISLGSPISHAQNPMDPFNLGPPLPCQMGACGGNSSPSYSSGSSGPSAAQIAEDKRQRENRELADRLYAAAFEGVDKALKTKGAAVALHISQNPRENSALMAIVEQARDRQYLTTAIIISNTMVDTAKYINGERKDGISILGDTQWNESVSSAPKYLDKKPADMSELSFLQANQSNSLYFSLRTQKAAAAVVAVIGKRDAVEKVAKEEYDRKAAEQARIAEKAAIERRLAAEAAASAARQRDEHPLRALLAYIGLPQTAVPPKQESQKYSSITLYTLNAIDAYAWEPGSSQEHPVETGSGATAGLDPSILTPMNISIKDKVPLRVSTRCVVLVDTPAAVVIDGKKLMMAKCSDPHYFNWPAPEIDVLIPHDGGFTLSPDEADASLAKPFGDYIGRPSNGCYVVTGTTNNTHYIRAEPTKLVATVFTQMPATAENHTSEGYNAVSKKQILIDGKKQREWMNVSSNTSLLVDPYDYIPSGTSEKKYIKVYLGGTQGVSVTFIAHPAVYVSSDSIECRPWPK